MAAGGTNEWSKPFTDRRNVTSAGAADKGAKYVAPAGDSYEPVMVRVKNGDTVARDIDVALFDASNNLIVTLFSEAGVAAGASRVWPAAEAAGELRRPHRRFAVSDGQYIKAIAKAVAANEDVDVVLICRHAGAVPTITELTA